MKHIITGLSAALLLSTLGACVAVERNPAHTTVYTPSGAYDYHCPPGHRKKGWC